jgi:hypothetical protein
MANIKTLKTDVATIKADIADIKDQNKATNKNSDKRLGVGLGEHDKESSI